VNILGAAIPARGALWAWTAVGPSGETQNYQTHSEVDYTEARMLAYLARSYPYAKVTNLKRIASGEFKPQTPDSAVSEDLFMHGIRNQFKNYVKALPADEQVQLIQGVRNLGPVIHQNGQQMPDPYQVAVLTAVELISRDNQLAADDEAKRITRTSIKDRIQSLRR
jgi:hypothetical protein